MAAIVVTVAGCGPLPATARPHRTNEVRALHRGQVVDGVPCLIEDLPERHIHVHLQILRDGVALAVPAGIGVGRPWGIDPKGFVTTGDCFAWIHTHDTTGVVHIVTPEEKTFTLGQLFEVWGQPLEGGSALGLVGPMTVTVDGQRSSGDPRQIPLANLANIVIELGARGRNPPSPTFDFGSLRG
ncbi:MAG: hypothetical protein NVS9B1_19160 [Candidatus Dormibacteraceae bacterium]